VGEWVLSAKHRLPPIYGNVIQEPGSRKIPPAQLVDNFRSDLKRQDLKEPPAAQGGFKRSFEAIDLGWT